jgi:hypothetical protein
MTKATKMKQLFFSLPNNVGLLMDITAALVKAKINVEAICAYAWEELDASFMMVTDDNAKAKKVLSRMGAKVELQDVLAVEVPNKVGELHKLTKSIAFAGIDIYFVYGSPAKGKMTLIFQTENDKKALKALTK